MLIPKETRLRKANEDKYQEASPPADRSRPLEWRRSFNHVRFVLSNVSLTTYHSVNDTDWDFENKKPPWQRVKAAVKTQRSMVGNVDPERTRDRIHLFVKADDTALYKVERINDIEVVLLEGDPVTDHELIPNGVFNGSAFVMRDEDRVVIQMVAPTALFDNLATEIRGRFGIRAEVSVELLSFSYEVDDALREHHHSRDLIIEEHTPAPLHTVRIVPQSQLESFGDDDGNDLSKSARSEQRSPIELRLTKSLDALQTAITRLTYFAYVALGIVVLSWMLTP